MLRGGTHIHVSCDDMSHGIYSNQTTKVILFKNKKDAQKSNFNFNKTIPNFQNKTKAKHKTKKYNMIKNNKTKGNKTITNIKNYKK